MSVETHAILYGHFTAEEIAALASAQTDNMPATIRAMHKSEYKIIELTGTNGTVIVMHAFLNSYAAEDYVETFSEPSTLLTIEYTPQHLELLRAIAAVTGGLVRKTNGDPWVAMGPAQRN